jgi:hypothetical protein
MSAQFNQHKDQNFQGRQSMGRDSRHFNIKRAMSTLAVISVNHQKQP